MQGLEEHVTDKKLYSPFHLELTKGGVRDTMNGNGQAHTPKRPKL